MDKAPEKLTDIPGLSTWDKQGGIDVDGKHFTWEQVSQDAGLRAVASGQTDTIYKNKAGGYTPNVLEGDFESSISLNKKTGNIEIKAPQFVLDSETFKRNYTDNDTLKNVSQAYKLNPDYKIPVTETNKDTGEEEEKQYAIEEYIEKLNEEFTDPEKGMVAYVIALNNQRKDYAQQFGGYGSAFTEQQISMSQDFQGKAIPIPDFMVNFNIAGYPSWLQSIRGDIQDGYIAVEDFNKFYNRDNLDREDIAVILGTLNKYIENAERYGHNPEANYADTYIDEETGEEVANPFRPDELARALALKNYILSHDPEANALQAAWDGAGVFFENFGYGVARVFLNLDNIVEGVVSGGQSHMTQDFIEMFDAYQQDLNNKSMLANDSASVLSFLGTIGGVVAGTWLVGKAGSTILDKAIDFGTSAGAAAEILSKADDISRGAQLMLKINTVAENASIAANIARTWFNSRGVLPFATRFLLDTVHDAMLYDSVNLRKTLEASDQETRDYWLGQLADNAKWWAGMAVAKGLLRGVGKGAKTVATKVGDTSFGQWLNAYASKNINKLAAFIGDKKSALKDRVAGGSLVRKLETQLEKAIDKGDNAKANRLRRKIQQVEWNEQLREARRALGDTQLDSDGLFKLSSESAKNFVDAQTRIKALENSIDSYNRSIEFKRQEMIGQQLDPATGRTAFINPSLGGANVKTTDFYMKLSDMNAKYGLSTAEGSLVSQDVTNYLMGQYHQSILQSFAETGGTNAAKAVDALEKVNANLDDLRGRLPNEITRYVDDNYHTYTEFYYRLNEYGKSKGLVDIDRITGYENNPIWRENGYMPIVVEHEQMGRWIANDSRIDAVIEQDFNHFSFNVQRGQNYVDPEMVRQTRISNMAQAEVNVGLWKAYSGFGSSATNELQISGQESAYVRRVNDSRMALDNAVSQNSKAFAENFDVEVQNVKRRKPVKNKTVSVEQRTAAIADMSPTETRQVLTNKEILTSEKPNLIDNFGTKAEFDEWARTQKRTVQNQLNQIASQNGYNYLDDLPKNNNGVSTVTPLSQDYKEFQKNYVSGSRTRNASSRNALKDYQGLGFPNNTADVLNDALIGNRELTEELVSKRDAIRAGLTQEIASDGAITYAGVKRGRYNFIEGENVDIKDFLSTSTSGDKAMYVGSLYAGGNNAPMDLLRIRSNTGEPMTTFINGAEAEVLFRDGTSPKVLRIHPEGDIAYTTSRGNVVIAKNVRVIDLELDGRGISRYEAIKKAIDADGAEVESALQRAYLAGDSSFAKSSTMNEAARNVQNGKNAFYDGVVKTEAKGKLRNITNVNVDTLVDDLDRTFRDGLEDYVASVTGDKGAKQAIDALSETANGGEAVGRYIALKQLQENGMDNVYKSIDEQIDVAVKGKKVLSDDVANMKKQAHAMVDSIVENELNNAASVTRTINPALVDGDDIYAKAKSLTDKIEGVKSGIARRDTDVIMYLDDQGRQVFSRVDPAFASLFNYRFKMDKAQASALARANALMSKLFRYGTTSVNLSSFGNQLFRDFGNALVVGGAWQTIKTNADNLVDVFGEEIVEQIKRFDPSGYEFRQVQELAEQTGQTIEQAAVSRELMRGAAISPTTTERTLYKDFMKQAYGNDTENMLTNARTKLQEIVDKYNPEELLNGKRENYLRNRVYANSLNDAMNSGLTLEQSRVWAEFAMNNATTNFSRQLYHMQAIADSTPYFRAAINGTKSFWRMWSLDPVGITGRMMGGLILPAMFLTGASLGDEESKKIYKNIPEYQKAESLVFVINGGVISVPIPQEMANIVAPFRQFVEYLNDANPNDFWELMMNDALGFSPIDLTAFTTIDMDKMINDPTFFDRVDRGVARVFSQMAPIPVKTAYMLATGTDPYSGKKLNDPSYAYWNDETGTVETMDYSQNAFAKWFASLFGDSMNAALAEKIVSGILGSTGSNVLGDLTALIQEGPDAWVESVASNAIGQVTKPFSVEVYDLADSAWKRAVRQLTAEKDAITSSKKWAALNSELSQTKDPEKRQKILAERQNLINDYQQRVADTVKRLSSEYGGTYDRQKFAATIQLLNFNTDPIYQSGSQYSSNLASEAYWDSRDAAIHTMQQLGITGTNDMSIFGYLTTDSSGNPVVRYTSPVAIMDMENQWQNQDDINMANIKALLTSNNMYDAHKSVTEQIQKIYGSKSKLTNQDRATIEAIQINWNAELAKTIAPYVSQMTPEAAINNTKVLNLLYPYIEVPGDWEVNNSGKYVSLGSRGNKKKAYYDSWVKSMFGINDPYKGQY